MPYLTGDDTGAVVDCRTLGVPDDLYFRMAVRGALMELARPENWEQFGDQTPEQYAELANKMVLAFFEGQCFLAEGDDMELIAQYPLQTATVSQVSLTGIPDTFDHLLMFIRGRSDFDAVQDGIELSFQFDGLDKFSYAYLLIRPDDINISSDSALNVDNCLLPTFAGEQLPLDLLGYNLVWIYDYASTVHQKSIVSAGIRYEGGAAIGFEKSDAYCYWDRPSWKVEEINIVPSVGANFLQVGVDVYGVGNGS